MAMKFIINDTFLRETCFIDDNLCPDELSECFTRVQSNCSGNVLSSRYDNASAAWAVTCSILMFFMKAGFLYVEQSFSKDDKVFRRRVVLAKYIDIFAGTFGFWLFGYAVSGNSDTLILGEEQDFIFWFFRFTFASNTATILGGALVGQNIQLRTTAIFTYSFIMTAFIHPSLARLFWSGTSSSPRDWIWSPYAYCNGTFTANRAHSFVTQVGEPSGAIFIDAAGSGLVHLCGGMGGFVLAIFHKMEKAKKLRTVRECGGCFHGCLTREDSKRKPAKVMTGQDKSESEEKPKNFIKWMYPSGGGEENVESAALGILILWTTWFAFNAGSTESISGKAVHATVGRVALVMCVACASAGTVQVLVSGLVQIYKRDTNFNTNEIANVVLGTLVAVTGCCHFIEPGFAVLIGVLTVGVYHLGCYIEYILGLYDGAKIFPVHGMCGFWGVLCVGIFSKACLIRELYDDLCFCVDSRLPDTIENRGLLFGYQLAGGIFIALWSFTLCSIMFLILWFFPIKALQTCLPWVFCFKDEKRGKIAFSGNVLFTHFHEIGEPNKTLEASVEGSCRSSTHVEHNASTTVALANM